MASRRITVRVLVVNANGKLLVMRRSLDDENVPGRVDFPGGGVEPGENCETAIVRELKEEAGLDIEDSGIELAYAFTRYEDDSSTAVIRQLYVTRVSDQQVSLSREHYTYDWHSLQEVERMFANISWNEATAFVSKHQLLPV